MKIAIMGAGGLGGYFGARLSASGEDVSFIARGAHLDAMRKRGLRVKSALGDLHLEQVQATDDPAQVGPVDLVLMSVKLWDTEAAARAVAPLIGTGTAVVSFQNGVTKDDTLRRVLGADAVMGGVSYIAAAIGESGQVVHLGSLQKLVFGEFDGRRSERAQAFLKACVRAGIDAQLSDDIRRLTWEKFVFLVGLSGTTSTMRQPIGLIRQDPSSRAFLRQVIAETVAVGRGQGIALADDFVEDRLRFCDSLPYEMSSSMHGDLQRGKPLELPWLSGAVADMGRDCGIDTPANSAVASILSLYLNGAPN